MANSLIQGGPSPVILADWCYNYMASKENFAPTDFSLTEQFKERCDIKKVNLIFFLFYSQTDYVISGYRNAHNQTSGSNPPSKYKCAEPATETQEICVIYEICSKLTIETLEQC